MDGGTERRLLSPSPLAELVDGGEGVTGEDPRVADLQREVEHLTATNTALTAEVSSLTDDLKREREQCRELWHLNCLQLSELEDLIALREGEIVALKSHVVSGALAL